MVMSEAFQAGVEAAKQGKKASDNPYICGTTKLGNVKYAEDGIDWDNGFRSMQPARIASKIEIEAAQSVDVTRFRKKANKYYR